MAFNGSGSAPSTANAASGGGNSGNQDGPLNKRLCTGKENNEAGLNNNRVSSVTSTTIDFIKCHATLSLPPLPTFVQHRFPFPFPFSFPEYI